MRRRKDLHPILFRPGLLGTFRWMAYWLRSRGRRRSELAARSARAAATEAQDRSREVASQLHARIAEWREGGVQRTAYTQAPLARWRDQ